MKNNDVIRSMQHVLKLDNAAIVNIFKLARQTIEQDSVSNLLKDMQEPGYIECDDQCITHFLDGLITYRRGNNEKNTAEPDNPAQLNNNIIVKKLRIAFDLREDDLIELMSLAEYDTSKSEISSIFRKPGNKHYRECSDDFLMALLIGLTFRKWD